MLAERAGKPDRDLFCRSRSAVRRRGALFRSRRSPDGHRLPRGRRSSRGNPIRHRAGGAQIRRPAAGGAARRHARWTHLTPQLVDALISGLRRDFALTILDLPSVWTAWTNRALQLADRIVLVTRLSVPHVHLVRRQLGVLALQNLDSAAAHPGLQRRDRRSAESARRSRPPNARSAAPFDIVLPEDARVMGAATNQGLPLSAVRRGTKLEKAVGQLADAIAADALVGAAPACGERSCCSSNRLQASESRLRFLRPRLAADRRRHRAAAADS